MIPAYDIVLFPPEEESGLTNKDSEEENQHSSSNNPNHLGKGILSSQAELATVADKELPDLTGVKAINSLALQSYFLCTKNPKAQVTRDLGCGNPATLGRKKEPAMSQPL
jgi:hypothetical protein